MSSLDEYAEKRPTILVVDDTADNLALMSELLRGEYRVKIANRGKKALELAATDPRPDLMLLDVMMPEMDGYEVCAKLKASAATADLPVVFLTAKSDTEDERRGLELGAIDYITKPISPPTFLARIRNHIALKSAADFLRDRSAFLEEIVERRTLEVRTVQEVTIMALASLAETRDNETGNHIRRTQGYVGILAERLKTHPRFVLSLPELTIKSIVRSAPLHDIGKVGIPDRILLKPGKLEPEEFEIMKRHTILGKEAIESAERTLGSQVEFLRCAKEIALSHHEKWDGSGYPEGLAGDDIPVPARLMAIADVYDALISKRVYKEGMSHDQAAKIIIEGRSKHFDPDVVDVFIESEERFKELAARLA
jgi:Response regulator containing a CheY-like receiver domain and an HD-GYP domain